MERPGYDGVEGGVGGKFRRRLFRRAAPTPYARPPSAARGGHKGLAVEGTAGGSKRLLSRIVDPASRFVVGTASRFLASGFFSSVFQKRLKAPPQPEAPGVISQAVQENAQVASEPLLGPKDVDLINRNIQIDNSGTEEISKLEQMVKQKTFTRAEFEHLTDILRARIIDNDVSETETSHQKLDAANVTHQENARIDARILGEAVKPFATSDSPKCEAASPAELAKTYMGSRAVKLPPSAFSLQNQAFYKDKTMSNGPKPLDLSVAPRSVIRYPDSNDRSSDGYLTPRPLSRSAIFRMSRSPYFKAQAFSHMKGTGYSKDENAGPSSLSFQTPKSNFQLSDRQILKRRNSVLESDAGSFGPIRRIRQKSSLISSAKGVPGALSENIPQSRSSTLSKDNIAGSSSVQKPLQLDERISDITNLQNDERAYIASKRNVDVLPSQSSETARKIFQELGKLVPSPPEKSSKASPHNEFPFKMPDSVDGQAPVNIGNSSPSHLEVVKSNIIGSPFSSKQHEGRENDPSTSDVPETNNVNRNSPFATLAVSSNSARDSVPLDCHKNSTFQMHAPEASLEADSGSMSRKNASRPLYDLKDKNDESLPQETVNSSKSARAEGSLKLPSTGIPSYSSKFSKLIDTKHSVERIGLDFTFPTTASSTYSQPPTPTMPPATVKAQTAGPVFTLGSNAVSAKSAMNGNTIISKANTDNSSSILLSSPPTEDSRLNKGSGALDSKAVSKQFGSVDPSVGSGQPTCTPDAIGSNCSLNASSAPLFSAPGSATSSFIGNVAFPSSGNNASTASPLFSSVPSFKSGSASSQEPPAPQLLDKPGAAYLEQNSANPFSSAFSLPKAASTSASLTLTPQFSSIGSSPNLVPPSAISNSGSVGAAASTLSSFASGSQSTQAPSSTFSITGTSNLMFGSSTQPSGSSSLFKTSAAGSTLSTHESNSKGDIPTFAKPSSSQFSSSSSSLGLWNSSGFGGSQVGVNTALSKPLSSNSPNSFPAPSPGFSFSQSGTSSLVASSSLTSTPFIFGSSSSSPSPLFPFAASTSASSNSSFAIGPSSGSAFSLPPASMAPTAPSFGQSFFGTPRDAANFNSGSPSNDQMNVEDSMVDDTNQAALNLVPGSGQQGSSHTVQLFGAPAVASAAAPVFQFGGNQSSVPSSTSPFQAGGSNSFAPSGSFSLGSSGVDKSNRRIIKVRRKK